jgi:diguanylate cyclase (GGDEF)-like protein
VIEIHSAAVLGQDELQTIEQLRRIYRNMYRLLEYSDRDALTGLLNRKSLDDAFYSAVLEELDGVTGEPRSAPPAGTEKERRHRVPANYWLGLAVVDQFGQISDKHGHLIAEEVLLLVARILNNTFRTYDQIYRFGGENFGVLMHCPEDAVVMAVFERFRTNVEKFNFPQVGRVTVSCGFTTVMADDSPSTAMEKTERTVDYAQKNGGNKVCSHLELVRRGFFGDAIKVGAVDLF